jgi:hypothetical protein
MATTHKRSSHLVTARLSGFKQEIRTVTRDVQQISRLDFTPEVGTATEGVEVTVAAPCSKAATPT